MHSTMLVTCAAFLFPAFVVQFTPSLKALTLGVLATGMVITATGMVITAGYYLCARSLAGGDHGFAEALAVGLFVLAYAGLVAGVVVRAGILVITHALSGSSPESSGRSE